MTYQEINNLIPQYTEAQRLQIDFLYGEELRKHSEKVVVLDDDPTGTQTVHGVYVYTSWEKETFDEAFVSKNNMFYILTNSRSFTKQRTIQVHKEIAKTLADTSAEKNQPFILVSRGDSTLRGHYPLETEALISSLLKNGIHMDGEIFCPFFQDGGRYTYNCVHYVRQGEQMIPAAETEFAKDTSFGYHSSDLREYIEEKSGGRRRASDCFVVELQDLRALKISKVTSILDQVVQGAPVIVNAMDKEDLKVFAIAFLRSMSHGKKFICRSAASLPQVLGGVSAHEFLSKEQLRMDDNQAGGLIIIGSHVNKTNRQLNELKSLTGKVKFLEFKVPDPFSREQLQKEKNRVLKIAEEEIKKGVTVAVFTSRKVITGSKEVSESSLEISVEISDALTGIVRDLTIEPSFILAKGGITSSDVATKGLQIQKAYVLGQAAAGVPIWRQGEEARFPGKPYIIFPGNVGSDSTLREVVERII